MSKCPGAPSTIPSVLSALDPKSLKVLDSVQLPANIASRITTTRFRGHDYVYLVTSSQLLRYEWDGHSLKQDSSFGPVTYTKPGQSGGGSPTLMGDWVILNTMGLTVPMSIVAVSPGGCHAHGEYRAQHEFAAGAAQHYRRQAHRGPGQPPYLHL